jgi:hypothetical protein
MRAFPLFVVTAAVVALATPVAAEPAKWLQAGTLACTMGPSIGLVRGGHQQARCIFKSATTKLTGRYTAKMEQEGHEAGVASGSRFIWTVLTQTGKLPAALVGHYIDATGQIIFKNDDVAEAALCSIPKPAICLRPLAGEMWVRENLAFGVSALRLE